MAAVASGKLRHKVQLQEQQITQDPVTGEMVTTWVTIAEPWAEIVPMSGREFLAAAAEQSEVRGRIVIRYREGVDASMRVVYRGKYYNIFAVLPDAESGKEHLTLMVGEGVRSATDAIIPSGDLAGPVREALGASLRSMHYISPDFAGMYQDAAGTTPVTAVGQPVGLMLDRRFGLERGPELIATPLDFTASPWSGTIAVTLGVNSFSSTNAGTARTEVLTPGKTYEMEVDIASSTSTNTRIYNTQSGVSNPLVVPDGDSLPNGRFIFTAVDSYFGIRVGGPGEVFVNSISIRELPGNHASQATTTARPTLRSGPLRIDYDGVDDYLRTVFPDLGSDVTIARSIPGVGAQILTGQTIAAGDWDDSVTSCATLVIDRALTGPETALVTEFLNQQAGV